MNEPIIYNRHTSFDKRGKPPIVRIDAHNGNARIQFSVEAVKLLELEDGDCISFIVLPKEKELVYFFIDNQNGIALKVGNQFKSGFDMGLYCRALARKLLDHFGISSMRSFVITKEKTTIDVIMANNILATVNCFFIDKHKTYSGKYKVERCDTETTAKEFEAAVLQHTDALIEMTTEIKQMMATANF